MTARDEILARTLRTCDDVHRCSNRYDDDGTLTPAFAGLLARRNAFVEALAVLDGVAIEIVQEEVQDIWLNSVT